MREETIKRISDNKIIAIVRGLDTAEAVKTAKALYKGGIGLIEVTFDQSRPETFNETANSIKQIKSELKDVFVGAGTVLNKSQVDIAKNAGAQFIVSPDVDEEVIKYTVSNSLVSIPGGYTATEIKRAYNFGADFVKVFPCIDGATNYIKMLSVPFSHIRLLAFGGVNTENCADYIKAGATGVGVGSCLVNKDYIKNGEYDKITELAKALVNSIKK